MQGTAATAVIKNGTGVLTFSVTDDNVTGAGFATFAGDVNINGGTVRYGIASALPSTADVIFNTASGTATLDLNNRSGTIASLTLGGASTTVAAVTTGTGILTLGGNVSYDATNNPNEASIAGLLDFGVSTRTFTVGDSSAAASDLQINAICSGAVGLIKDGSGTLRLGGTNTYTGTTTVNAGTLALTGESIDNPNQLTINAGKVDLTGVETVNTLFFGGVQQLAGVWGSSSSAAVPPRVDNTRFSGTGTLVVSIGAAPVAGYSAWQSNNSTIQASNLDHDNDGVANGVEHFHFGTANSTGNSNPLPGFVQDALSVTWTKGATYTGTYGIDFVVESSTTLTNPWATEIADPTPGFTVTFPAADKVKYTFPAGTKRFARLKVVTP